MNLNLKEKIDEISNRILQEEGMEEVKYVCFTEYARRFRYAPTSRKTYHGTYLNPFSLPYEGEPSDKPLRWSDVYAKEAAEITVSPLYRHNGTEEDVNAVITVSHVHSSVAEGKEYVREDVRLVEAIQTQSPTNYLHKRQYVNTMGKIVFKVKVSGKARAKSISNAVEKAMSAVREFVPRDHSAIELNPADYHESTDEVCDAWIKARKEAGFAA